jgi:SpoVK/Ycf46/Vps4 family AAA+-type ATPase
MSKALAAAGIPTRLTDEERRVLVANLAGSPLEQVENTLRKAAKAYGELGPDAIALAKGERLRQLQESKAEFIKPPGNAIAGLEVLMGWVRETLVPSINLRLTAKRPDLIPERKGIVLVGPPGTGKTLAAQAITEYLGVPGIRLSMAAMMNSGLGDSEQNLLKVFDSAKAIAPCVLFVDELDKAGLNNGGDSDGGTTRRMTQAFLEFLNEPKEQTVFVICAMNRLDQGVPPEFTRPGRFDEIFLVDMPNRVERQAILKVHCDRYRNTLSPEQLAILAEQTQGFSGADLLQIIVNTWYSVFNDLSKQGSTVDEEKVEISYSAIQAMLSSRRMVPSGERFKNEIQLIRELAKHAISASLPDPNAGEGDSTSTSAIAGMV